MCDTGFCHIDTVRCKSIQNEWMISILMILYSVVWYEWSMQLARVLIMSYKNYMLPECMWSRNELKYYTFLCNSWQNGHTWWSSWICWMFFCRWGKSPNNSRTFSTFRFWHSKIQYNIQRWFYCCVCFAVRDCLNVLLRYHNSTYKCSWATRNNITVSVKIC